MIGRGHLHGVVRVALGCVLACAAGRAGASGPRWVGGNPYFSSSNVPIVWFTNNPLYFTDPGDLSAYVTHAQADALVAAAAGVWNVPIASVTLARGGALDEHVSGANAYPGANGIVFPADVQVANYQNKQIAVVYDTDGSVTDLLLGSGASNPTGCRTNAVTESVDSFNPDGHIQHAVLVLNGRCTGPTPEQQTQMRYLLMRAFGRVLGLGWSQTNDNVFTGSPRPTYAQALHWPVMHPIDIICGPYTYQCMPQPFTLRDDDLSGLTMLYPVKNDGSAPPGKTPSLAGANQVWGTITFPNGQGMQGVNMVVRQMAPFWSEPDPWETVSSVTGYTSRWNNGNPVSGTGSGDMSQSMGWVYLPLPIAGMFWIWRIPLEPWEVWDNLVVQSQPVNPLYTGTYAVGPYNTNVVAPSGSSNVQVGWVYQSYFVYKYEAAVPDAASGCDMSGDGTEGAPAQVTSTGWWIGNLCAYGHSAWSSVNVAANRTLTVEVTAKDEHGVASAQKMLPVVGVWKATDATGTLPTVAAAPAAFNSMVSGTTRVAVPASSTAGQLRMVIADERGDGRPDYGYQARVFYADSAAPSSVPAFGGQVTIEGMGFRPGNSVSVNGMAATVSSWTANSITLTAPWLHNAAAVTADVAVRDLVTGATSMMAGALSYAAPAQALVEVSAPTGQVYTNMPAAAPFVVQALEADGVTPIVGLPVTLSATAGQVRFGVCGAGSCVVVTDAQGKVSTTVTPLAGGSVTISAATGVGTVTASFSAVVRVQTVTAGNPALWVAARAQVSWTPVASVTDSAASTRGVAVAWSAGSGLAFSPVTSTVDATGMARTSAVAGSLAGGAVVTGTACAWTSVCADFTVTGVALEDLAIEVVSGDGQSVAARVALGPVMMRVVDTAGHPVAGATVEVHQTVEPWMPACSGQGRCPVAPVLSAGSATMVSGLDGTVTIAPMDLAGVAERTKIVVAVGTQGFVSLVLERVP